MPKVSERKLSLGELKNNLRRTSAQPLGTKNFATFVSPRKNSKHSYIKTYKLKDKHLISDDIVSRNHLRTIKDEI